MKDNIKKSYILAIETSTQTNACAFISIDGTVLYQNALTSHQTPSEDFLPMLDTLRRAHGIAFSDCAAIAVTIGPGSFTGIRFGIGLVQGLAFALGIPIVPLSTLAVLAASVPPTDTPILTIWDARMGECYWGLTTANGIVEAINKPEDIRPAAAVTACVAVGNGLSVYPDIETHWPIVARYPDNQPEVSMVAKLGLTAFLSGQAIAPDALQPNYLRNDVATPKGAAK